jgi:Flp pilus assembly protein TadG
MRRERGLERFRTDPSGTTAVEFAMVAMPFLMLLLFVFELSYDLFSQSVLDNALQLAARQLQTGNAQNVHDGNDFIVKYMCPDLNGLLTCSGVYVNVQRIAPTSAQDYWDYTTGSAPVSGGVLDLGGYVAGSFCNSGPSQLLLVSAVYVGPSFIGGLLPGVLSVSYGGRLVHPTFSSVGIVSEAYTPSAATQGAAKSC